MINSVCTKLSLIFILISCHFPTVPTHTLSSSTCCSFHYPPSLPIAPPPWCLQPTTTCWQLYNWCQCSSQYSQSAQSWLHCSVLPQMWQYKSRVLSQYNLQYGHLYCWYFRMFSSSLWTLPVLSWSIFKSNYQSKFYSSFSLFWFAPNADMPGSRS